MKRNFWIGLLIGCVSSLAVLALIGTASASNGAASPSSRDVFAQQPITSTVKDKVSVEVPYQPNGGGGPGPLPAGFTYQGLIKKNGGPFSGNCDMQFGLWDSYTGGTVLQTVAAIPSPVSVTNGLFTTYVDSGNIFQGDMRYLQIDVRCPNGGGITETLSARQPLYATPYALGLLPGAIISGTAFDELIVKNYLADGNGITGRADQGSDGWGVLGYGSGRGVYGFSANGYGLYGQATNGTGIYGTTNKPTGAAIYGHHTGDGPSILGDSGGAYPAIEGIRYDAGDAIGAYATGAGNAYEGNANSGNLLYGFNTGSARNQAALRVFNTQTSGGMAAYITNTSNLATAHFANNGSGEVLYLQNGGTDSSGTSGGDFIKAVNNPENDAQFRVLTSGEVRSDVGFSTPAADFAEMLPAASNLQSGDVLIMGSDGKLHLSTRRYQASVVGVYSTKPGFVGGSSINGPLAGTIPLAIVGIVPVKVSAENGAIHIGDLLAASSTPGHAMRAGSNPPIGSIIGKALGSLDRGTGTITLLVMMR